MCLGRAFRRRLQAMVLCRLRRTASVSHLSGPDIGGLRIRSGCRVSRRPAGETRLSRTASRNVLTRYRSRATRDRRCWRSGPDRMGSPHTASIHLFLWLCSKFSGSNHQGHPRSGSSGHRRVCTSRTRCRSTRRTLDHVRSYLCAQNVELKGTR